MSAVVFQGHLQIVVVMDRITRISWNAFVNYFTQVVRFGKITKQDKYRLLVVYFFYYLMHKTFYAYDFIRGDVNQQGQFVLNDDKMVSIIKKFESLLDCLSADSCFIKPLESDKCIPLLTPLEIDTNIAALIANDCDWGEINYDPNDPSFTDGDGFIYTFLPQILSPGRSGDFITEN